MKKVSVIVPVFNVEKYLKQCIESILSQTYRNLEILLIDDGSTDSSGIICDQYGEKDQRVKVVHKKNGGLSSARNMGIDAATGAYIAFVDSDDSVCSQYIDTLLSMCMAHDCQIAQCDFLYVSEESVKLGTQRYHKVETISREEALKRACRLPEAVKYNVAWNKLYARELFDEVRYPENRLHEDEFTTYQLIWRAKKIGVTDAYLYYYLQRNDSITGRKFDARRLDGMRAYRERLDFLYKENLRDIYYEFAVMYYQSLWVAHGRIKENIKDCGNILAKLEERSDELAEIIMRRPGKNLLENIRVIYSHLPEKKKSEYRELYGNDAMYGRKEEFLFPFERVPACSRIALYGAGNVGKVFYRQNIMTRYTEITLWVDNLWKSINFGGYGVKPVDALVREKENYDFIVLAIRNMDMAMTIKKNLIDWGIRPDKIIWRDPVLIPVKDILYYGQERKRIQELKDDGLSQKKKFVLMNTPEHGNLGDHALAAASKEFLNDYFPEYETWEFSGKQWDHLEKEIRQRIHPEDVIFFVGGGYMGDLWPKESARVKNIAKAFPGNKKIFLPQTFFYSGDVDAEEVNFWKSEKRTYFMHREKNSQDFFLKHVVEDREKNASYPDLVLYWCCRKEGGNRKGVGICFRDDKEKAMPERIKRQIEVALKENGMPCRHISTVKPGNISMGEREDAITTLLDQIRGVRFLITDRLHGMLFAAITHTPCVVFDNKTHKIKGVYQWLREIPYIRFQEADTFDLQELAEGWKVQPQEDPGHQFQRLFSEMADKIREWLIL